MDLMPRKLEKSYFLRDLRPKSVFYPLIHQELLYILCTFNDKNSLMDKLLLNINLMTIKCTIVKQKMNFQ